MDQSTQMLDMEPYQYPGEAVIHASCEDWVLVEVDAQGNPIRQCQDAEPDQGLLEGQFSERTIEERFAERLAEETRRSYEAGYEKGSENGSAAERDRQQAAHTEKRQRLATAVGNMTEAFVAERARFYERLEQEAVKLALAVAGRILRREAQMDPLFLLGAVRVALGQLTSSTKVRLRVPSADEELWTEAMALLPNRDTKPEVIAAEGMRVGECVMETELGSADLGVRAQIGEIERGMFDRGSEALDVDKAAVARR
jgi:flagellar assembly protein FliH